MKLLEYGEKDFVRVIIGNAKTGDSNLRPPTRSFSIEGITVEELADKILELVQNEDPIYNNSKKKIKPKKKK